MSPREGLHGILVIPAAVLLFFAGTPVLRAAPKASWECNRGSDATAIFSFAHAPSPSRTDAANSATFTVLSGRLDGSSAPPRALNDGRLPSRADEPDANVFFAAGTEGGRLLIDLGKVVAIDRVDTYSWHPGTRGPQVYELYGSAGSAKGFDPKAARSGDPSAKGWARLASVDTRARTGRDRARGGQYAVSILDDAGGKLGRFRYLLLVVHRTESRDSFGNTFFSEIDVLDGRKHRPSSPPPLLLTAKTGAYEIRFDLTETPELKKWVEKKLEPVCTEWYPKIVKLLPSKGYSAPRWFTITFKKGMKGVAYTSGTRICCAERWFSRNLDGEAAGAVVHEMVHVVQQYGRVPGGTPSPSWMVEGLADYIRWFLYEPKEKRPHPDPDHARYTDGYRTTAAFLDYVVRSGHPDAIRRFDDAMRRGRYTKKTWIEVTGHSVDQLWADYVKTLRR